jgi:hypothetical protein
MFPNENRNFERRRPAPGAGKSERRWRTLPADWRLPVLHRRALSRRWGLCLDQHGLVPSQQAEWDWRKSRAGHSKPDRRWPRKTGRANLEMERWPTIHRTYDTRTRTEGRKSQIRRWWLKQENEACREKNQIEQRHRESTDLSGREKPRKSNATVNKPAAQRRLQKSISVLKQRIPNKKNRQHSRDLKKTPNKIYNRIMKVTTLPPLFNYWNINLFLTHS